MHKRSAEKSGGAIRCSDASASAFTIRPMVWAMENRKPSWRDMESFQTCKNDSLKIYTCRFGVLWHDCGMLIGWWYFLHLCSTEIGSW